MSADDPNQGSLDRPEDPPRCGFCRAPADIQITFFSGLVVSGDPANACLQCVKNSQRLKDRLLEVSHVRLVSWITGQKTTGSPERMEALLGLLKPRSGFKSITAAIRITSGSARGSPLSCAACQEAITPEAPGTVRWSKGKEGLFHSVRLFHTDCCTDPAGRPAGIGLWEEIDHLPGLDRTRFTPVASEMLDQIQKLWDEVTGKGES